VLSRRCIETTNKKPKFFVGFDTPEEHGLLNHQRFHEDEINGKSGG